MTTTIEAILPALKVLAVALEETNESYQLLVRQSNTNSFCQEAGHSLRVISDRYAQVLIAFFEYTSDVYDEEDEDDSFSEEEDADSDA